MAHAGLPFRSGLEDGVDVHAEFEAELRELLLDLLERRLAEVLEEEELLRRAAREFADRGDALLAHAVRRPDREVERRDRPQEDLLLVGRRMLVVAARLLADPGEDPRGRGAAGLARHDERVQ